jgi:methylated-DNA-[protein]-cysteine S-methyltransferase
MDVPMDADLAAAVFPSPVGPLALVASPLGLSAIRWDGEVPAGVALDGGAAVLAEAASQLAEYFGGTRRVFDLPLDLVGTPFQREAWRALRDVPFGETLSYGEQARRLGRPAAARAVGAANGRNPLPIVLPCHRLVGSDGSLTGFGGGLWRKRALLEHEASVVTRSTRGV